MKNARSILCFSLLAALAGCGATSSEPQTDARAADTCAGHSRTDACITEENFAQCQAREAECPGQVLSLESCPLQFACPSGS